MNVLSLFDGMSCGRVALERAGIPVTSYHACEIDKYARAVSFKNYPDIIHHGDVTQHWPNYKVDLLIGGSPCQGFSFAGKGLAFDDPRSKLFFEFVRIWNEVKAKNPDAKFLLENVRMKKEHLAVITEVMGVEPVCINSALVSAQNRVRYYWTNIGEVSQPADLGILLKDIIEDRVDFDAFKISEAGLARAKITKYSKPRINPEKTGTMNLYNNSQKLCFDAGTTFVTKDFSVRCVQQILKNSKTVDDKSIALCVNSNITGSGVTTITDGEIYRRLSPIECERLQTLPDNYTEGVSNSQRYKMLGNGWTVDVIAHIFKGLK